MSKKNEGKSISRRDALRFGAAAATTAALGMTVSASEPLSAATERSSMRATAEFQAKSYRLYHYSGYSYEALITLAPAVGYSVAANLYFKKEGVALPANFLSADGQLMQVFLPISRLNEIIETLRVEAPIWLVLTSSGIFSVSTLYDEPVGEQEV